MQLKTLGPNKTVLKFNNGLEIFFSYETPVAGYEPNNGFFRAKKYYSVTTSKHINEYLNGAKDRARELEEHEITRIIPC